MFLTKFSEIIFVGVQTPHHEKYEGITELPQDRVDFDYTFLKNASIELFEEIQKQHLEKTVIIISTVLPETIEREIKPLLNNQVKLCYNPFFIAMGTTITDFLNSEVILFGVDDKSAAEKAKEFYKTINNAPFHETTLENAELIKVVYNTFISTKIAMINTIMETCYYLPNTDVDDVTKALALCTNRIISPKYLTGGMGDGGGCHPRDNIAMSHLSRRLYLSYDWFENIMMQREKQTDWLADLIEEHIKGFDTITEEIFHKKILILGKSFKPETNITTGSPSILLKNILEERGHKVSMWDPYVDTHKLLTGEKPMIYFIGTKHPDFTSYSYNQGSIIIDPWRYIPEQENCEVIHIGVGETFK